MDGSVKVGMMLIIAGLGLTLLASVICATIGWLIAGLMGLVVGLALPWLLLLAWWYR